MTDERGAPPEKPVCLICGLPPDHEWHGVSNHVYVPKLAGHDSAGAAQPKMKDDPVYGAIRVAICDEYIAAGSPTPKENWLYSRLVEAALQFAYEAGAANSPSPEVRQAWVSVTEKFPRTTSLFWCCEATIGIACRLSTTARMGHTTVASS